MSTRTTTAPPADGRDTRWTDHRSQRREALLAAAIAVIDREGPAAGVATIATEAGIPRSVVYKLFRDRDDLDEQIRRRIIADVTDVLMPAMAPQGTARELVRKTVKTYVGWVRGHTDLHRFLAIGSASRPSHGSSAVAGGKLAFAHDLSALISAQGPRLLGDSLPRGMADDLAFGLIGLTDNVVNNWLRAGRERSSAQDLVDFLTESACGVLVATARLAGTELDLDAKVF